MNLQKAEISNIIHENLDARAITKERIGNLLLSLYISLRGMEIAIYMNPDEKLFKNMCNPTSDILLPYLKEKK